MDYIICDGELYHHGTKGMKWGVRRYQNPDGTLTATGKKRYSAKTREIRGHAGPGKYVGSKRQLAGYKRDLEFLDKGGHLSVGATKKRQAELDKRDRENLEKKIAKLEADGGIKRAKEDTKNVREAVNKYVEAVGNKVGARAVRGHAGPGKYVGEKRQLEGYKRDLELLNKGGHLSYGTTKKRQDALDKRDRELLEKKISKLENKDGKKRNR